MRLMIRLLLCFFLLAGNAAAAPSAGEMAGAMLMVGFRGAEAPASMLSAIRAGKVGSVILFDRDKEQGEPRNIVSPGQLEDLAAALQRAGRGRLIIAVDQEGGAVRRLREKRGFSPLPSAREMGGMRAGEVKRLGKTAGREMRALGINADLAPVVDVGFARRSPGLGDTGRIFGPDPASVSSHALAFADGLREGGVIPALKHFPGLGSADMDSHFDLPDVTKTWRTEELIPYREAFRKGWKGMVLVAHVYNRSLDPVLPASLSPRVIGGLLRRQMGWKGVVVSDDLQMGAVAKHRGMKEMIRLAIDAGCDILLFGNNLRYDARLHEKAWNAIMELVDEGAVSKKRLEESWRRIEELKREML